MDNTPCSLIPTEMAHPEVWKLNSSGLTGNEMQSPFVITVDGSREALTN